MMVTLRDDWAVGDTTYVAGSLLVTNFERFMAGDRAFDVLFEPDDRTSLAGGSWTQHHLVLNVLEDVKNKISVLTPGEGGWTREPLEGVPDMGTVTVWGVDDEESDEYFMLSQDFITPSTLSIGTIGEGPPHALKSHAVLLRRVRPRCDAALHDE